jgi:4-aminobutyrate aminotransferase-like enzyme
VDVVTIGKMLQGCMVLFTDEYNPKAGLVAGTFSGSGVALRTGRRIVEMLAEEGWLGRDGKIERLSARFVEKLRGLSAGSCKGKIGEIRAIGGMIGFVPFEGRMDQVKAVLMRLFDLGVVAFYCGHGPNLVRMLPPLGAMKEAHIDEVCRLIESAVLSTLGGLIGIVLGGGVSFAMSRAAGWAAEVTWPSVALAFFFSVGVGIVFGFWPARKASRLSPIEALRYE